MTNLLRFDHWTPQKISEAAKKYRETALATFDAVANAQPVSVGTVIAPLHEHSFKGYVDNVNLEFLQHVSPDPEIREASVAADKEISEFEVTQSMRVDLFRKFQELEEISIKNEDAETRRFLERQLREGRRNGLHLDEKVILRNLQV